MATQRHIGFKSGVMLPHTMGATQGYTPVDVSRLVGLFTDGALVASALMEYLLQHGEHDESKTRCFDIGQLLLRHVVVADASGAERELRAALQALRLAVVSDEDEQERFEGSGAAAAGEPVIEGRSRLLLSVHPSGTIRRAVATGYAVRVLLALKPTALHAAHVRLEPSSPLANPFYIGDACYRTIDEAVKGASKRLHTSVTNLPDSEFFDIAEGVLLYNQLHYWTVLSTGELPLAPTDSAEATPEDTGAEKPQRLMALWKKKWYEALEVVRRVLYVRDYGAFFSNSPFLLLAGRFPMEVPEFPPLKAEDRQGNVFEGILHRVDRTSIQRYVAFLQRAATSGRCEYAVRQSKTAGVIRVIGEAIGSIRTPIKIVDLCFQALTVVAQNVPCHRQQLLHYCELFPSGFAGDLLEHGFVVGAGRGGGEDTIGVTIPALITKNFLHRRDAWAVLSQLHPSFVHINERLVQEACRRALPRHFMPNTAPEPSSPPSGEGNEQSPTHYRASEDLFMIASAMVVLSHAATNANAKRSQLVALRPCVAMLMSNVIETLRSAHCKIPGWDAQQVRLGVASMRIVVATLRDWLSNSSVDAAQDKIGAMPDNTTNAPIQNEEEVVMYPQLLADICVVLQQAPLVSCLMSSTVELLQLIVAAQQGAQAPASVILPLTEEAVVLIVATLRGRMIDEGFEEQLLTPTELELKEDIVWRVTQLLMRLCLDTQNWGDAGSIMMSLGVHHCHDWGLDVIRAVNAEAPSAEDQGAPKASVELWVRLATAMGVVYAELLENCDVTAVARVAGALVELLQHRPQIVMSMEPLLPLVLQWLTRPIYELLEAEEVATASSEVVADPAEVKRGLLHTRNAILCALLDCLKAFTSEVVPHQPQQQQEETVTCIVQLVQQYRNEVPYLNPLLQCLVNLALSGVRRAVFQSAKALLRSVADASKHSGKLTAKLFAVLDEKDGKKAIAATDKAPPVAGGASGVTVDRMEYLANSQNTFQRLVATPSAANSAPSSGGVKASALSDGHGAHGKEAARVPKGFTLVTYSAAGASRRVGDPANKKAVRSSECKAKDAHRRVESAKKASTRHREGNDRDADRAQPENRTARRGDVEAAAQPTNTVANNKNTTTEPTDDDAKVAKKKKQLVNIKGDVHGINLDLLTARMKHAQDAKSAPAPAPSKPSSWANMAKTAKTREERDEEMVQAAREEEERLTKLAADRAAQRRKAQQEEDQLKSEQRLRKLEEELRRNRGAVDLIDSESHVRGGGASGGAAAVDVHALLNRILTKPVHVVRQDERSGRSNVAPRLPTIDDDDDNRSAVLPPPGLGATSVAASLSQLRFGGGGQPVVHRADVTAPPPIYASHDAMSVFSTTHGAVDGVPSIGQPEPNERFTATSMRDPSNAFANQQHHQPQPQQQQQQLSSYQQQQQQQQQPSNHQHHHHQPPQHQQHRDMRPHYDSPTPPTSMSIWQQPGAPQLPPYPPPQHQHPPPPPQQQQQQQQQQHLHTAPVDAEWGRPAPQGQGHYPHGGWSAGGGSGVTNNNRHVATPPSIQPHHHPQQYAPHAHHTPSPHDHGLAIGAQHHNHHPHQTVTVGGRVVQQQGAMGFGVGAHAHHSPTPPHASTYHAHASQQHSGGGGFGGGVPQLHTLPPGGPQVSVGGYTTSGNASHPYAPNPATTRQSNITAAIGASSPSIGVSVGRQPGTPWPTQHQQQQQHHASSGHDGVSLMDQQPPNREFGGYQHSISIGVRGSQPPQQHSAFAGNAPASYHHHHHQAGTRPSAAPVQNPYASASSSNSTFGF